MFVIQFFRVNLRNLDMNPMKKILGGTRCRKVDKTSCAIAQSVYIQAHFGGRFLLCCKFWWGESALGGLYCLASTMCVLLVYFSPFILFTTE